MTLAGLRTPSNRSVVEKTGVTRATAGYLAVYSANWAERTECYSVHSEKKKPVFAEYRLFRVQLFRNSPKGMPL